MVKGIFDTVLSLVLIVIFSTVFLIFSFLIWKQDLRTPFYVAPRVGKDGEIFNMIKFRSMIVNADKSGVVSTANDDDRITPIGKLIRKYKFDELTQLINVLIGNMSLVGPRPQIEKDVKLYTEKEKELLQVLPGITDFSSIVFADESSILVGSKDPDLDYDQLIRPWKSRLGIFYIKNKSFLLDIKLILLTAISIILRQRALNGINKILVNLSAESKLIEIAKRNKTLTPYPPPGSDSIVTSRE